MKVIVPHTHTPGSDPSQSKSPFLPSVRVALELDGWLPEYHEVKQTEDYHDLFFRTWDLGEPFIVVEHDIIPWPGALRELADCPEPWCTFPYLSAIGWVNDCLGCTKFNPGALTFNNAEYTDVFGVKKEWRILDRVITDKLRDYSPHVHRPGVTHLKLSLLMAQHIHIKGFHLEAPRIVPQH